VDATIAAGLIVLVFGFGAKGQDVRVPAASLERPILPEALQQMIAQDQKQAWTLPLQLTRGQHWKPTLGFLVVTAALVKLDTHDTPRFRRTDDFSNFNKVFSSFNTGLGEGVFPAAFYLIGLGRGDSYAEKTGLLSMEALADAEIVQHHRSVCSC
jgi:hypothetical protein